MASKNKEREKVEVVVPKTAADVQRFKLEKLMKSAAAGKTIQIHDRPEDKLPRVFNPPEFIRNIWGSSAGAGSGDFHVYRGIRRREYARQKFMAESSKIEEADAEYKVKVEENQKNAEKRTAQKRKKRNKKKCKQEMKRFKRAKGLLPNGKDKKKDTDSDSSEDDEEKDNDDNSN